MVNGHVILIFATPNQFLIKNQLYATLLYVVHLFHSNC